ncbi:PREDICTED: gap junction beta-4 protein-like [Nanorana parkeri]|uniref:gap junction beta-4 protein-like n=1 Tax=Nanorana parkeri TaxID=125878 RepID=UPI0008549035|nr:PREDICTED: gap junction beta-4 protein-like [Nanorana parkeri]
MAMVTGLIPILRTALEATTDYTGRTMWFGFAVVRLLALYVSEIPWGKLDLDFDCQGNITSEFCRKSCFSNHFSVPVVSLWNSAYVYFVVSVLLMELFTSQLRHNLTKSAMRGKADHPDGFLIGTWSSDLAHKDLVLDFHHQRTLLVLYLFCIFLRLVGELTFLYFLMGWHLPMVSGDPIECSTSICPGPFTCLVRFPAEKRMSLYLLGSLSIIMAMVCIIFALYSICHYLTKCRTHHNERV